jgi:hypothetical protein
MELGELIVKFGVEIAERLLDLRDALFGFRDCGAEGFEF